MDLSGLVYAPLKEEEKQLAGWSKSTIDYVMENKTKVFKAIRGIAKGRGKVLQKADVEDIYIEIVQYMYHCDDYNIEKAIERSSREGVIVSLEGYVHSCIKFCVIRYITEQYKNEKHTVRDSIKDEDGKELSLLDTIKDDKIDDFTAMTFDLAEMCKAYECQRYSFGPDIFLIWFVRLQTLLKNKTDTYKDILNILGISKKEISQVEKRVARNDVMTSLARAITATGIEKSSDIIRGYTYYADRIEEIIDLY